MGQFGSDNMNPTHRCKNRVYKRGTAMRCMRPSLKPLCGSCSEALTEQRNHLRGITEAQEFEEPYHGAGAALPSKSPTGCQCEVCPKCTGIPEKNYPGGGCDSDEWLEMMPHEQAKWAKWARQERQLSASAAATVCERCGKPAVAGQALCRSCLK